MSNSSGFGAGNWFSPAQNLEVLQRAHGEGMRAKRDYAMLAMLFGSWFSPILNWLVYSGCDLMCQGHWAVISPIGKGGHIRTVSIPEWVKLVFYQRTRAAGVREGRIFRLSRGRKGSGQGHCR